jgi:polyisoprenyl-teichoic acid--peptidoglycan teichoic acid transferase
MKKKQWIALIVTVIIGLGVGGGYFWLGHLVHQASTSVLANPENPVAISSEKQTERVNILLLGSDARGDEAGRTDSIIFISADLNTQHVSVISIPRDTRVNLPGIGLTKITHANAMGEANGGTHSGTSAAIQAVSNLLGVPINAYLKINFVGFQKIVDTLGGIDVDLPKAVDDRIQNIHLAAGKQHLNGETALRLARVRYGLSDGDFGRQRDQFYLLTAIAHKLLSVENISKLPEFQQVLHQDLMDTNLADTQMLALGTKFKGISKDNIKYYQLPGKGITAHDPLVGSNVYYFEVEQSGLKQIVQQALEN